MRESEDLDRLLACSSATNVLMMLLPRAKRPVYLARERQMNKVHIFYNIHTHLERNGTVASICEQRFSSGLHALLDSFYINKDMTCFSHALPRKKLESITPGINKRGVRHRAKSVAGEVHSNINCLSHRREWLRFRQVAPFFFLFVFVPLLTPSSMLLTKEFDFIKNH